MTAKFMKACLALSAALIIPVSAQASPVVIGNAPTGSDIGPFGSPDTQTYGQVFTAPITGTLTSFTLSLNGGVGALFGGVGTWNGGATWTTGFGSPTNLYKSGNVLSSAASSYTFTPNISVTAGSRYVAYISVFGVPGVNTTTRMPLGTNVDPNLNYFVWNNTSDPRGNAQWNYFFDAGDASFTASFAVPEPATWAMLILGFGVIGGAMRRRQRVSVRFA